MGATTHWATSGETGCGFRFDCLSCLGSCAVAVTQIGKALECLHKHNIVHGDIKPENVFRDKDGNLKVGDLGQVGGTVCQVCSIGLDGRTPIGRLSVHRTHCSADRRAASARP